MPLLYHNVSYHTANFSPVFQAISEKKRHKCVNIKFNEVQELLRHILTSFATTASVRRFINVALITPLLYNILPLTKCHPTVIMREPALRTAATSVRGHS